jgi:hypothetical protein
MPPQHTILPPPCDLNIRFPSDVLISIMDEAFIYQCACPAQVAELISRVRKAYAYQENCLLSRPNDLGVHHLILAHLQKVHAQLEHCLDEVLTLENWDRSTFKMPENLRVLRDKALEVDDSETP